MKLSLDGSPRVPGSPTASRMRRSRKAMFTAFSCFIAIGLLLTLPYIRPPAFHREEEHAVQDAQEPKGASSIEEPSSPHQRSLGAGGTLQPRDSNSFPPAHPPSFSSSNQVLDTAFSKPQRPETTHGDSSEPSIMVIISRYHDDVTWLSGASAGLVTDNSTGTPKLRLPISIYQAADIGEDGNPSFPGLEDHPQGNMSVVPDWPEWARAWVAKKNATQTEAKPGSAEDAERELRMRLGLKPSSHKEQHEDDGPHRRGATVSRFGKERNEKNLKDQQQKTPDAMPTAASSSAAVDSTPRSSTVLMRNISDALPLRIVPNRGAEAMAYLTGIIDNYDKLPEFIAFMHGHRNSWHMALPQDWQLRRLATSPPRNRSLGFLPLGCHEREAMDRGRIYPRNIDANFWSPNGPRWHEALAARYAQAWAEKLGDAFDGDPLPEYVKLPCGASFVTTREAVLRRPKQWYEDLRQWLLATLIETKWLGIVMEFSWGYMFSGNPILEFSQEECFCNLYNVCTLPADY